MMIFRICDKCKARYLLFHLQSDCKVMNERFIFFKTLLTKITLDKSLGKSINGDFFKTNMLKFCNLPADLEEKSNFLEWSRCASAPFLILIVIFVIGLILYLSDLFKWLGDYLLLFSVITYFLWVIFLLQGGFNLIIKRIMILDLMKRYNIKIK